MRDSNVCDCSCHRHPGIVNHCMPCCQTCDTCGANIRMYAIGLHHKEHDEEILKLLELGRQEADKDAIIMRQMTTPVCCPDKDARITALEVENAELKEGAASLLESAGRNHQLQQSIIAALEARVVELENVLREQNREADVKGLQEDR